MRVSLQSSGCRAGKQFDILDYFGVLWLRSIVEYNIIRTIYHNLLSYLYPISFHIYLDVLIDDICCNLVINLQSLISLMLMGLMRSAGRPKQEQSENHRSSPKLSTGCGTIAGVHVILLWYPSHQNA